MHQHSSDIRWEASHEASYAIIGRIEQLYRNFMFRSAPFFIYSQDNGDYPQNLFFQLRCFWISVAYDWEGIESIPNTSPRILEFR